MTNHHVIRGYRSILARYEMKGLYPFTPRAVSLIPISAGLIMINIWSGHFPHNSLIRKLYRTTQRKCLMQRWNIFKATLTKCISDFSGGGLVQAWKSSVPSRRCVRRRSLFSTMWKTVWVKHLNANSASDFILYSVWSAWEAENCSPFPSQYFSCGVLIYPLAAVLQPSRHQRWIKQGQSILSCHVTRKQIQYVLKADGWRQGLCLNAHRFCREKWAQLNEWGNLLSVGLPACCSVSLIVPRGWMWLSAVLQGAKAMRVHNLPRTFLSGLSARWTKLQSQTLSPITNPKSILNLSVSRHFTQCSTTVLHFKFRVFHLYLRPDSTQKPKCVIHRINDHSLHEFINKQPRLKVNDASSQKEHRLCHVLISHHTNICYWSQVSFCWIIP